MGRKGGGRERGGRKREIEGKGTNIYTERTTGLQMRG